MIQGWGRLSEFQFNLRSNNDGAVNDYLVKVFYVKDLKGVILFVLNMIKH